MIGLAFIIVIIVIVAAVVLAKRSKRSFNSQSRTERVSITRRVWLYLITLISLGIFSAGVGQLLALLFDATIEGSRLTQVGETTFNLQQLSLGLAMTVIGGPLWFLFWRAAQRRIKGNEEEIGDISRKIFLNFVLLETALMGITAASNSLKWLMAGIPLVEFPSNVLAIVIVAVVIWSYHWRVSEGEGHPSPEAKTLRRWYVYILSGFGLVWLGVGLVQLINTAVINLPVWGNTLVQGYFWDDTARMCVAQIILGGVVWYFHWFRMARGDFDSTLRQVYFYLLTVSGGAIAALVASTILLFRFFLWVFGGTPVSVSPHFQFLGWAVSAILVGSAIWGYHRRLAQEEAGGVQERRQSAQRVYFYLMSFLGIGTFVAGLSMLFGILVDMITYATGTSLTITAGWWRNQLALSLALLLVGTPLWLYYWSGVLKRLQARGIEEWRALSRRIFLYVIVGISIIALTADLVNIIYQLLNGIFQGNFGVNVLRSSKWSLQTLVIALPLLWYHWQILKTEQHRGAEVAVIRRNITLLADDRTVELASRLETKLGYKIQLLYQVGQTNAILPLLPDEEIDRLVNEIQSSPSDKVMLVVIGGKVLTLPYQDK
jgi:ABC-type multidrug transport system fused ATPase/permease subunit